MKNVKKLENDIRIKENEALSVNREKSHKFEQERDEMRKQLKDHEEKIRELEGLYT